MSGIDAMTRWKSLKQRLSFKGLGCCGPTWSPRRSTIRTIIEEEDDDDDEEEPIIIQNQLSDQTQPTVVMSSGMNLAMALAAERNLRRSNNVGPATATLKDLGPPVKTLMRLIEETEGVDLMRKNQRNESGKERNRIVTDQYENGWVCCVCMERNKGAAFIPCGHTFCRVCSREIWVNKGSCPICNRSIVEILDLF